MTIKFKSLEIKSFNNGKINIVKITGKLNKEDYDNLTPVLDNAITNIGKINLLVELHDFKGWTAGAAWEDSKFGLRHYNDIKKLAIVGDRAWEKNLTQFAKVFMRADIQYFDREDATLAYHWIEEE